MENTFYRLPHQSSAVVIAQTKEKIVEHKSTTTAGSAAKYILIFN